MCHQIISSQYWQCYQAHSYISKFNTTIGPSGSTITPAKAKNSKKWSSPVIRNAEYGWWNICIWLSQATNLWWWFCRKRFVFHLRIGCEAYCSFFFNDPIARTKAFLFTNWKGTLVILVSSFKAAIETRCDSMKFVYKLEDKSKYLIIQEAAKKELKVSYKFCTPCSILLNNITVSNLVLSILLAWNYITRHLYWGEVEL